MDEALHVLVIDDQSVDRAWVRRMLERDTLRRWEVAEAETVEDAEQQLRTRPFDAVALDLHLAGGMGAELLGRLRPLARSGTAWVMLTGAGDEELATATLKAGASDYLSKNSISPDRLRQALWRAIEAARLEMAAERAQERLAALVEVWPRISPRLEPEEIARQVLAHLGPLCACSAAMELRDPATGARLRVGAADLPPVPPGAPSDDETEFCGGVLVLAVRRGARDFGRLLLHRDPTAPWAREDLDFARAVAQRAAIALDNTHLFRAMETSMRARDEIFAMASHDLRNPLGLIGLAADLLDRRADDPAAVRRQASRIRGAVQAMNRTIDEILDTARMQLDARIPLKRSAVDLAALVREGTTGLDGRHTLDVRTPDAPVFGSWDRARLRRVLENLLANAIKYSPNGSTIGVTLERTAGEAVLSVRDEGIGIPEADLPHIFERFHRASNAAAFPGTGIGLSGAARVVEAHGGRIDVASTEGKGTTFTVHLPLA